MTWPVTADVGRFAEAVDHFLGRVVLSNAERASIPLLARSRAFWVAGAAQLDAVQYVFDELNRAIEEGLPFQEFKRAVKDRLTEQWGKPDSARIETILRNATQTSYNAGRYRQMSEPAVLKYRPFWIFDAVLDSRTSKEICQPLDSTILPATDPFWDSHTPPLHHRCRSGIRSLRQSEADRLGVASAAPDVPAQEGFGASPRVATDWKPSPDDKHPGLIHELNVKASKADLSAEPL